MVAKPPKRRLDFQRTTEIICSTLPIDAHFIFGGHDDMKYRLLIAQGLLALIVQLLWRSSPISRCRPTPSSRLLFLTLLATPLAATPQADKKKQTNKSVFVKRLDSNGSFGRLGLLPQQSMIIAIRDGRKTHLPAKQNSIKKTRRNNRKKFHPSKLEKSLKQPKKSRTQTKTKDEKTLFVMLRNASSETAGSKLHGTQADEDEYMPFQYVIQLRERKLSEPDVSRDYSRKGYFKYRNRGVTHVNYRKIERLEETHLEEEEWDREHHESHGKKDGGREVFVRGEMGEHGTLHHRHHSQDVSDRKNGKQSAFFRKHKPKSYPIPIPDKNFKIDDTFRAWVTLKTVM